MFYFIITIIDADNNEWAVGNKKVNLAIEDYYRFLYRLEIDKNYIPDIVKVYVYITDDEPNKEKLFHFMMNKVAYDFLYLNWSYDAYNCYNK